MKPGIRRYTRWITFGVMYVPIFACGSSGPPAPSPVTVSISGVTRNAAGQLLGGVTVEAGVGANAGASATSQADGAFTIEMTGVTGGVVLRATKEGYVPAATTVDQLSIRSHVTVSIVLSTLPSVPTIRIVVSVADTAFQPLSDVRVEILNGPTAGESVATTGGRAVFSGPYSGMLQIRATKDGFAAATDVLDLDRDQFPTRHIDLNLQPARTATLEPGDYALTFVAAAGCTAIPRDLRTRRYDAAVTVSPQAGIYAVLASGGSLQIPGGFTLGLAGTSARFPAEWGFWERLPPIVYFDLWGSGAATVEATTLSRIEMRYDGRFRYCSLRAARASGCNQAPEDQVIERGECVSQDHRVILERR